MSRQIRAVAVVVVLAAISFLAYGHFHHQQRGSLPGGTGGPVTILVAKKAIPKGTSAHAIATKPLYRAKTIDPAELPNHGALVTPLAVNGKVTVRKIPAGAEITNSDFGLYGHG